MATLSKLQSPVLQSPKLDTDLLGKIGSLSVRLARTSEEIEAAQRLRYEVFYCELGAQPSASIKAAQRDEDKFDAHCEHLLVIDENLSTNLGIVGTYRLMDRQLDDSKPQFYSQSEFELQALLNAYRKGRFLELGRSCIAASHRSRRTMELAWHGVWSLVVARKIDVMFGCASFQGTNPDEHANGFGLLNASALLNQEQDCPAIAAHSILLRDFSRDEQSNTRDWAGLPPLLKGYLRLGAKVSSEAVIDEAFGTIDVLVVIDVNRISQKYIDHYGANASRFAA